MGSEGGAVVLIEAGMTRVKELRGVLTRAGIEAHILRPPTAGNT
jgi:hypothetical protein